MASVQVVFTNSSDLVEGGTHPLEGVTVAATDIVTVHVEKGVVYYSVITPTA